MEAERLPAVGSVACTSPRGAVGGEVRWPRDQGTAENRQTLKTLKHFFFTEYHSIVRLEWALGRAHTFAYHKIGH